MNGLALVTFFASIIICLVGGLFFVKAEKMYMKRIGRESGWAFFWDVMHYQGKEARYFVISVITVLVGILVYFAGHPASK